jgi:hypothetical protein
MYDFFIYESFVLHFLLLLLFPTKHYLRGIVSYSCEPSFVDICSMFIMLILSNIFSYPTALQFSLSQIIGVLLFFMPEGKYLNKSNRQNAYF